MKKDKEIKLPKTPKFTPEFMREVSKNIRKSMEDREKEERRQEAEQYKTKKENIGTCTCGGNIVVIKSYISEFNPMHGPMIIGPGSRSQFYRSEHRQCFCEECGIIYNPEVVKKQKLSEVLEGTPRPRGKYTISPQTSVEDLFEKARETQLSVPKKKPISGIRFRGRFR